MRFKQANPMKISNKYRQYSPTAMTNAYRAVLEQKMPVKRAALTHGVPQNTLRQRVLGRVDPETTSSGPSPTLTQSEEAILVEHIKSMAQLGYGYTSREVVDMASNYATYLQKRDSDHPFSLKWFHLFMKRWPELSVNKPRPLSTCRAKAASEEAVDEYFRNLDQVLTKFDLKSRPECIYNVDEKGIQTEHCPPYVVSAEKSIPGITSSRTAITTILGCGNALGTMVPPFFVFKGKRFKQELMENSSSGAVGVVSDSGWSNSSVFQQFLEKHFIKCVQRENEDQHVLLIFDGHKSHINVQTIEWADKNKIELFVLPAHTSHILQPLDVGCFGPLQKVYNHECHKFIRSNPSSKITRYNVASLASTAYENALSASNLRGAFRRSGIYPFNPSVITHTQVAPAEAYITHQQDMDVANTLLEMHTQVEDQPAEEQTQNQPAEEQTQEPSHFFKDQRECIVNKQKIQQNISDKVTVSKLASGHSITEPVVRNKLKVHMLREKKNKQNQRKGQLKIDL